MKARSKTPAPLLTDHPYFKELKKDPHLFDERGFQRHGGDTCPLPVVFLDKIKGNIASLNSRDDGSAFTSFSAPMSDIIKRSINRLEPKKKLQMPLALTEYEYEKALDGITLEDLESPLNKSSCFSQPYWLKARIHSVPLPAPATYLTIMPQRIQELIRLEVQWHTIDRFAG